jgi:hypothetical protein
VVAGDDRNGVCPARLEPALDAGEGGVDAQDQVAILGPGARQELGGMRAREGTDQHRQRLTR